MFVAEVHGKFRLRRRDMVELQRPDIGPDEGSLAACNAHRIKQAHARRPV
jgi:hypothetical protein